MPSAMTSPMLSCIVSLHPTNPSLLRTICPPRALLGALIREIEGFIKKAQASELDPGTGPPDLLCFLQVSQVNPIMFLLYLGAMLIKLLLILIHPKHFSYSLDSLFVNCLLNKIKIQLVLAHLRCLPNQIHFTLNLPGLKSSPETL